MLPLRRCVKEMTGYVPGEAAEDKSTIKLNQNENRYPPSPRALKAIEAAAAGLALYPESSSAAVRQAAAQVYSVSPGSVMVTNGSDEMLRLLFQTCCEPGDSVAAFYPSYTYYATLAAMHDVRLKLIDFEGEFSIPQNLDLSGVKLLFLPNPNAPTGTVFPEAEVRRLAASLPQGILVLDEAYADFAGQTSIPLLRECGNIFVTRTFSKGYSLAGLRLGLGFGPAELMPELEKVRDYYNVDRLAQAGGEAALLDQDWLAYTTGMVRATRERVREEAAKLGVGVYDSGANFLLLRLSSPAEARRVFDRLRERRVLVRYFAARRVDNCLRVSIGTDPDMDVFLTELEAALK